MLKSVFLFCAASISLASPGLSFAKPSRAARSALAKAKSHAKAMHFAAALASASAALEVAPDYAAALLLRAIVHEQLAGTRGTMDALVSPRAGDDHAAIAKSLRAAASDHPGAHLADREGANFPVRGPPGLGGARDRPRLTLASRHAVSRALASAPGASCFRASTRGFNMLSVPGLRRGTGSHIARWLLWDAPVPVTTSNTPHVLAVSSSSPLPMELAMRGLVLLHLLKAFLPRAHLLSLLALLVPGCVSMQRVAHYVSTMPTTRLPVAVRIELAPDSHGGELSASFLAAFKADLVRNGPFAVDDRADLVLRLKLEQWRRTHGEWAMLVGATLLGSVFLGLPVVSLRATFVVDASLIAPGGRVVARANGRSTEAFFRGLYYGHGDRSWERVARRAAEYVRSELATKGAAVAALKAAPPRPALAAPRPVAAPGGLGPLDDPEVAPAPPEPLELP